MWETFLVNAILGVLRMSFKNAQKAAGLKHVFMEIHDDIENLYPEEYGTKTNSRK